MRYYTLIVLLFLLIIAGNIHAQKQGQARLDSLMAEVSKMEEDKNRVKLMSDISFAYSTQKPDDGLIWAAKCLTLASRIDWEKGIALAYNAYGTCYYNKGNYPDALNYFFKSLSKFEETGDTQSAGEICNNAGAIYQSLGEYEKALTYFKQGLKLGEAAGNDKGSMLAAGNIAMNYAAGGSFEEAIKYQKVAIGMAAKRHDKADIGNNTGNLGEIYGAMKQYDTALACLLEAYDIATETGDRQTAALELGNVGGIYYLIASDSSSVRNSGLIPAGKEANLANSKTYLMKAIALSDTLRFSAGIKSFTKTLSDVLLLQGDYRGALSAFKEYTTIRDSLDDIAATEKIANLETARAVALKDKDVRIAQLSHDKRRNERAFFLAGLLGLALIAAFVIRQSALRKKANEQLALSNRQLDEANRVKARFFGILSHDLRAPVANLTSYLYLQREAPEMMDEQARAGHRLTIENAANNLLSVMEDLLLWSKGQMTSFKPTVSPVQILQLFDEIKKLVPHNTSTDVIFDDPGSLKMDTDENFLKTIMRNLTANALKALGNQPGGRVAWKAWEDGGKKYLSVTDNGPGLTKEQLENLFSESAVTSAKTGLGLHIVRDFAQMLGQKIEVKSEVGKGTSFTLSAAA